MAIKSIPLLPPSTDFVSFSSEETVNVLGVRKIWVSKSGKSFLLECPDGIRKINVSKGLQDENHSNDSLIQMFPHLEVSETVLSSGEIVWTAFVPGEGKPQDRVNVEELFGKVPDGKTV